MGQQLGQQGTERLGACHQAHSGGEHVVDKKRGRCHQRSCGAKVFPRNHIGASTLGVGLNRLAIGEHHNCHQGNDCQGDWYREF